MGPEIRKKLLVRKDDGAYYMSLKNWSDYFDNFSFGLLPEHEDKYKSNYDKYYYCKIIGLKHPLDIPLSPFG